MIRLAKRLEALQSNVFADMDLAKAKAKASGKEIIDLSLGSSDLPAPEIAIAAMEKSLRETSTHGYALFQSTQAFRQAAASWYTKRYGVEINPETEVLSLIGCQEGTAHLPLALLNPGDYALLQDPGYPSHAGGVALAGGQIYPMALRAENQFLPVFEEIPADILAKSRLMVLSYPHNPTTAIASRDFFDSAVAFCRQHNLVLVHDFPYADIVFPGTPTPPSILQADPHKEVSLEFFTFSKSYNMGGFRIGYAVGNEQLIKALRQVKSVVDFNQYRGILNGGIAALESPEEIVQATVETFRQRRDVFVQALSEIGWSVHSPSATMYVWAKLPEKYSHGSVKFCTELVKQTGVAVSPGAGFGKSGEGYVRFALVRESSILQTAAKRISAFLAKEKVSNQT
ncbi:MAG: LL-diaminopimelate aminotransferase [Spirulinaceae cyanobacterium]